MVPCASSLIPPIIFGWVWHTATMGQCKHRCHGHIRQQSLRCKSQLIRARERVALLASTPWSPQLLLNPTVALHWCASNKHCPQEAAHRSLQNCAPLSMCCLSVWQTNYTDYPRHTHIHCSQQGRSHLSRSPPCWTTNLNQSLRQLGERLALHLQGKDSR
jgi:hypothetical protein